MADNVSKDIFLYNSFNRKKEKFEPVRQNEVSLYICGPTVYSYIHIGNARPLIFFDVVRRYLMYRGYSVKFVQNITDVDDKIIARAVEAGTTIDAVAQQYIENFQKDCDALGVMLPDASPKASEYIGEMVDLIQKLIDKGFAYEVAGNVFFDATKDAQYGSLSGKDLHHMEVGERVDDAIQRLKKDSHDFSLWKSAKPGEPKWPSPWSDGRPGWHTECVAMSLNELGDAFDIHAGGIDLIFPHHENEIAQARCGENAEFAKYWMHNEFVNLKNKKMAKSEGNVVLVHELTKKFSKEAIRLFFLQSHYRKPIAFEEQFLKNAESAVERIYLIMQKADEFIYIKTKIDSDEEIDIQNCDDVNNCMQSVLKTMNDDFNIPQALAAMFELVDKISYILEHQRDVSDEDIKFVRLGVNLLNELNGIFGIMRSLGRELSENETAETLRRLGIVDVDDINNKINELVEQRNISRAERNWEEADRIRDMLLEMGVAVEDMKEGTKWWWKGNKD